MCGVAEMSALIHRSVRPILISSWLQTDYSLVLLMEYYLKELQEHFYLKGWKNRTNLLDSHLKTILQKKDKLYGEVRSNLISWIRRYNFSASSLRPSFWQTNPFCIRIIDSSSSISSSVKPSSTNVWLHKTKKLKN